MKRVLAALFGTTAGLVALLNFKTHPATSAAPPVSATTTTVPPAAAGGTPASPSTAAGTSGSTGSSGSSGSSTSTRTSTGTATYTGDSVDTRWGPVQVRITVSGGKVTKSDAIVYPTENPRDQEINSYAVPALNQEAVSAGTAKIDTVSGATYTSDGYIQSLQSALDKAGL